MLPNYIHTKNASASPRRFYSVIYFMTTLQVATTWLYVLTVIITVPAFFGVSSPVERFTRQISISLD